MALRASTPATLPLTAFHTADSGTMHEENVKTLKESTTPMLDIIRLFCQPNRYAFNCKSADIHTIPRDDFRLFSTSNLWGLLCFVVFMSVFYSADFFFVFCFTAVLSTPLSRLSCSSSPMHLDRMYSLILLQPAFIALALNCSASASVTRRRITWDLIVLGSDCLCHKRNINSFSALYMRQ